MSEEQALELARLVGEQPQVGLRLPLFTWNAHRALLAAASGQPCAFVQHDHGGLTSAGLPTSWVDLTAVSDAGLPPGCRTAVLVALGNCTMTDDALETAIRNSLPEGVKFSPRLLDDAVTTLAAQHRIRCANEDEQPPRRKWELVRTAAEISSCGSRI